MAQKDWFSFFLFFLHHKFFMFNFYIAHCQHVDLLLISPRKERTFNIRKHLRRAVLEKKVILLSRFNLCKIYVKDLYFSKTAAFFSTNFAKISTVTGIFQRFYLKFKQFSIVCSISRSLSNGRFRKFWDTFQ